MVVLRLGLPKLKLGGSKGVITGTIPGDKLGLNEGLRLGDKLGESDGDKLGDGLGLGDGDGLGEGLGDGLGLNEGDKLGDKLGEGDGEGERLGLRLGDKDGDKLGLIDGLTLELITELTEGLISADGLPRAVRIEARNGLVLATKLGLTLDVTLTPKGSVAVPPVVAPTGNRAFNSSNVLRAALRPIILELTNVSWTAKKSGISFPL